MTFICDAVLSHEPHLLFVADVIFGEVGVSFFVAGAAFTCNFGR